LIIAGPRPPAIIKPGRRVTKPIIIAAAASVTARASRADDLRPHPL
jgi:hypothetical protein